MDPNPVPLRFGHERLLLVASTGGHLSQLHRLSRRFSSPSREWLTFDSSQSKSLLRDEQVHFVRYIPSRGLVSALRNLLPALRVIRSSRADVVISTGAALAAVALPLAVLARKRAIYIESVSRFDGPSLTGRMLRRVPGIRLYTQHSAWAGGPWTLTESVLDDYCVGPRPPIGIKRIFVTLGTIRPYRFDALVERVRHVIPADVEVVWQVGVTSRNDLSGRAFDHMSVDEMRQEIRSADVVVSHSGVGSALEILAAGKVPILVPRRSLRGEHVDDHQEQIASALHGRGLAIMVEADKLSWEDVQAAADLRVVTSTDVKLGEAR